MMKTKILIFILIMAFVFGGLACAQDIKYAIIKIPTIPGSAEFKEGVQIYFEDTEGNQHKGEEDKISSWPIQVKPEYIKGERLFIDHAMWHISNPTCVVWNGVRR